MPWATKRKHLSLRPEKALPSTVVVAFAYLVFVKALVISLMYVSMIFSMIYPQTSAEKTGR